ncbi:Gibberellin 2-beta-dioxygenase 7 [Acorus gramineus]|uniref:Gibberellin 2-beta-dioxygenase 7 n=1 Tax=Acorus gramineus TaxID=55184 RepID=A0AAV9AJT7_ACOGR|nr:Gibberellin 2-beta-dioxygenase 7 [Acorus gramineus]
MPTTSTDSSYPPLFLHPPQTTTRYSPPTQPLPTTPPSIPLIDLENLSSPSIIAVCADHGLFRLTNHGLPLPLSRAMHDRARSLFSLPFPSKLSDPSYFWGTPVASPVENLNWVEGLHIRHDDPNPFGPIAAEYGAHVARISRRVFGAAAEAEGFGFGSDSLRAYRYPVCANPEGFFGMDAHTDSSVVSIVDQDGVGGLQVKRGDEWVDVEPVEGTLLVIVGDMLQAMSNDVYKSAVHRVVVNRRTERLSICYFVFPEDDAIIDSPNYRPFTYREFRAKVQEDIKSIGRKVGLLHFRL